MSITAPDSLLQLIKPEKFQQRTRAMISQKKLIRLARKWQRIAAMKRRRISFPKTNSRRNENSANTSTLAGAGHFVIYSIDERRFVIRLNYLGKNVIRELLKMSEQVYGLPSEGPIKFPFDAVFIEYIVSLLQREHQRRMWRKTCLFPLKPAAARPLLLSIMDVQANNYLLAARKLWNV